jgi:hypothetical protein
MVKMKAEPTVPILLAELEICGAAPGLMTRTRVTGVPVPEELTGVIWTSKSPVPVGVPEIRPLAETANPGGSPLTVNDDGVLVAAI